MKSHSRRSVLFLSAGLSITAVLGGDTLRGQAVLEPAVNIARNYALSQDVWPGDFNGDGKTDLAATGDANAGSAAGKVVVVIGNGAGSFAAPIATTYVGHVDHVGDFNGDGKSDLLVANNGRTEIAILPGNGNGTFGSARIVHRGDEITFSFGADLNGDGKRDFVVASEVQTALAYPGRGDFTFDAPVTLATGYFPIDGIAADLNDDGRKDLVIANHMSPTVSVFLNLGAMTFAGSDLTLNRSATDATVADLNGDAKPDIVVSTAGGGESDFYFREGHVEVLLGRGDGTFAPGVVYDTLPGAFQVVAGDFNRDGIVDIATANRSSIYVDDCTGGIRGKTWDSVSVLTGTGSGTLRRAHNFSIGNQADPADERYENSVVSLNTNDLNRDGATDLIASHGAILFNVQATQNWEPTVNAGPDQHKNSTDLILQATGNDDNQDLLTWSWRDETGREFARWPSPCSEGGQLHPGANVFAVVVSDGHGHTAGDTVTIYYDAPDDPYIRVTKPAYGEVVTAGTPYTVHWTIHDTRNEAYEVDVLYSTDRGLNWHRIWECFNMPQPQPGTNAPATREDQCTWKNPGPPSTNAVIQVVAHTIDQDYLTSSVSGIFTIESAPGAVPFPWSHHDIGAVGAPGSALFDGTVFKVDGSGADIWNGADEFHYVYQTGNQTGDFLAAPDSTWEITTRVDSVENVNRWTKAGLMVRSGLAADAAHVMVLVSPGKGVNVQWRTDAGSPAVYAAGPQVTAPVWLKLGAQGNTVTAYYRKNTTDLWTVLARRTLAMSDDTTAGLAVTSHSDGDVATAAFSNTAFHTPPDWTAADVGSTGGASSTDGLIHTVTGRGADIWNSSDQFHFVFSPWSIYDGSVTARVRTIQNVHAWTKAGVMIRERASNGSIDPAAPFVLVAVTPGKGVTMQYRTSTGAAAAIAGANAGAAPSWVRLTRLFHTFTAEWSADGVTWSGFASVEVPIDPARADAGLAVSSHNASAAATATFDDVRLAARSTLR